MLAEDTNLPGHIDIICGGFPCQDISVGGLRAGISGSRSSLWKYMRDAICLVRPKFAIVENVAALCRRGLGTLVGDLAEVGYDSEWHCIPASSVGALHERDRVWVIGYPNGSDASNAPTLSVHNFKEWQAEKGTQNWQNMLDELGAGDVAQWADSYTGALRVLDGIPDRAYRLKALGNSLVPKIAEYIGKQLTTKG